MALSLLEVVGPVAGPVLARSCEQRGHEKRASLGVRRLGHKAGVAHAPQRKRVRQAA